MEQTIPRLHLYHIPRTGGMSIGLFMRRHNVVNGIKHIAYHINGHAHYRDFDSSFFTMIGIRNPVDHAYSLYKYIAKSKNHKESPKVSKMTFRQYIDYSRDSYFGFLTKKNNRSIEQAIKNLSKISFVYITPNLNDNLRIFLRYLNSGIKWHKTRFNVTHPTKPTKAEIKAVRKNRPDDFDIYEAAKKLNAKQIEYYRSHTRNGFTSDLDWSNIIKP